jgi:chromosome transmission fidelity protein 18
LVRLANDAVFCVFGWHSDDRSAEAFRERLVGATQMQEMMGGNNNPNCLILDEIDGALPGAISVLVELVKATGPTTAPADGDTASGKAKSKKRVLPLLRRPIICICNDVNAPALKPLKELALCLVLAKVRPVVSCQFFL